jgi:hypothetical protein
LLKGNTDDEEMKIPEVPVIDTSKCTIRTGAEFEPNLYLRLDVTEGLRCLAGKHLEVVKKGNKYFDKMCKVNDNIWATCFLRNVIKMYDESLDKLNEFVMSEPTGLTATDQSNIIVSSRTGLHVLNTDMTYSGQIAEGNYDDVKYYNNKLYALNRGVHSIQIFDNMNEKWLQKQPIQIPNVTFLPKLHMIFATDSCILVSNRSNLYVYNISGILVKHIEHVEGTGPGQFKCACLCGVDHNNTYIYCDWFNHRLQLADRHGRYTTIALPREVKYPVRVIIEEHSGVVWISTNNDMFTANLFKQKLFDTV